ncbi:beta-1,3-galactosyltransferase 5-like [Ylistrum balloti]|uniref:beta-1,3-galactosyltransferase 5-like n=1 Tax=Ylistrum balloti TaxID=509963 RepID=UPI002905B6E2|nr:beta-1,3-galactosyltransferase 5-like [Ylistrum balloti]
MDVVECTGCNRFERKPITEPTKACKQTYDNTTFIQPRLIIFVMSPSYDKVSRDAVRETWGDTPEQNSGNFRVVFVVGRIKSSDLFEEAIKEGDILQLNVPDIQNAMTEKVALCLQWFVSRCPNVEYVLKTKLEVFVNVPYIFRILMKYELQDSIAGHCSHNLESTGRARNDKKNKYLKEISGSHIPPYCSGNGYLLGRSAIIKLTRVFEDTPYVPMDDIYMGFCAYKTNVEITDVPGFDVHYKGYDGFQFCHCVGTVPKTDAGRQREIYVQQLKDCKNSWSRGVDDLNMCFIDFNDVVMPIIIVVLSLFLILLFSILRRKLN